MAKSLLFDSIREIAAKKVTASILEESETEYSHIEMIDIEIQTKDTSADEH